MFLVITITRVRVVDMKTPSLMLVCLTLPHSILYLFSIHLLSGFNPDFTLYSIRYSIHPLSWLLIIFHLIFYLSSIWVSSAFALFLHIFYYSSTKILTTPISYIYHGTLITTWRSVCRFSALSKSTRTDPRSTAQLSPSLFAKLRETRIDHPLHCSCGERCFPDWADWG